jgi:hypothetical protein
MALFDVPADAAVRAGVGMSHALGKLNRERFFGGEPPLRMGVGVNTGPLVLGTVGGQDRLKCGVVGDTVNTASRIERLTKVYGSPFLIGEDTYLGLRNPADFSIRMVDRVAVKGKEGATVIYEVLDAETPERRAAKEATRDRLTGAMGSYFSGAFAAAQEELRAALAIDPLDPVLALFAERAARYASEAPPRDWQGFERLTFK